MWWEPHLKYPERFPDFKGFPQPAPAPGAQMPVLRRNLWSSARETPPHGAAPSGVTTGAAR